MSRKRDRTWVHIVAMLGQTAVITALSTDRLGAMERMKAVEPTVRILEIASERTITVSWCDSLSGRYGFQTWRRRTAQTPGTCVLTGRPIVKGEAVYRPLHSETPPRNAEAMIAADCAAQWQEPA